MLTLLVNGLLISEWLETIWFKIHGVAWVDLAWIDLINTCYHVHTNVLPGGKLPIVGHPHKHVRYAIERHIKNIGFYRHAAITSCETAVSLNSQSAISWLQGAEVVFHNSPPLGESIPEFEESRDEVTTTMPAS